MGKMYTKDFTPKSTTTKARRIIREEIDGYYSPENRPEYGGKSTVENMTLDGNSATEFHKKRNKYVSDFTKAATLVDGGCFACYYSDQSKMLAKIYGESNVETWSGNKIHSTYKNLIAREYAAMVREQKSKE